MTLALTIATILAIWIGSSIAVCLFCRRAPLVVEGFHDRRYDRPSPGDSSKKSKDVPRRNVPQRMSVHQGLEGYRQMRPMAER